ncbi:MAG: phosphodiester glycosidase family protein [Acidobacteriota bacterium]
MSRVRPGFVGTVVLGAGFLWGGVLLPGLAWGKGDPPGEGPSGAAWRVLEPGLAYGEFPSPQPADRGDSLVRVLRIDPSSFRFHLLNASAEGEGRALTVRRWSRKHHLVAAINASMYQTDHRTSVSLMRTAGHINNPRLSRDRSLLAFDRIDERVAEVKLLDRDCEQLEEWRGRYRTLVQSIRMISCRGRNVWTQQSRKWSTAAIATDQRGRVLFILVRSPFSTHDLIENLKALPLKIERAMYLEGGPEAQMFFESGSLRKKLVGSYETGFNEDDRKTFAWPVPNVIGITRKDTGKN